jgi:hypothetical protein
MKSKILSFMFTLFTLMTSNAFAGPWIACGTIGQISTATFELPNFSPVTFEYGIAFITKEPLPVAVTAWNSGARIYNKQPIFVNSDFPMTAMNYGGFMFIKDTQSTEDNECSSVGGYRHNYWKLDANNNVVPTFGSGGCYGNTLTVYCRRR